MQSTIGCDTIGYASNGEMNHRHNLLNESKFMTSHSITATEAEARLHVNHKNYIRAKSDQMFQNMIDAAGGTNKIYHFRRPTPLDAQRVMRMNRDTLYSGAVFDAKKGVTITIPQAHLGRYISVEVIDNDHYCLAVLREPGVHKVKADTDFVYIILRIEVFDAMSGEDIAIVNQLQDEYKITSGSHDAFVFPKWNLDELAELTAQYAKDAMSLESYKGLMGTKGHVDEVDRPLVVASGWGLLPETEAVYYNYTPKRYGGKVYKAIYDIPKNHGFWSITCYGSDMYLHSDKAIINKHNAVFDADGRVTVYYGDIDKPNQVDIEPEWNIIFRVYRPDPELLERGFRLPEVEIIE